MTNWKHEVKFKDLLSNDDDQSKAVEVGKAISKRVSVFIQRKPEFKDDFTLDEIIECLDSINTLEQWESLCEEDSSWESSPPISELNGWLSELYDWCDSNRVWVK